MKNLIAEFKTVNASDLVYTGEGIVTAIFVGTDDTNDPIVGVYDSLDGSAAADQIIPNVTLDASALGWDGGILSVPVKFDTGLYIKIGGTIGTGYVTVHYVKRKNIPFDVIIPWY